MLKYTGRIGCSALTDLVLKHLSQAFGSLRHTLYLHFPDNQSVIHSCTCILCLHRVFASGQNVYENIRKQ